MARVKIREFDAKKLLLEKLKQEYTAVLVDSNTNLNTLSSKHSWLLNNKLVIKPDQLFGKRGKLGLVLLNADFQQAKEYLQQYLNKEITIGKTTDKLTHFLIEPHVEHEKEYYLSITSERNYDLIHFSEEGGINVEENWHKVTKIEVQTLTEPDLQKLNTPERIKHFIKETFTIFKHNHFCYLEFNPFTFDKNNNLILLDTVAQVDG